jgi:hypothetical protein
VVFYRQTFGNKTREEAMRKSAREKLRRRRNLQQKYNEKNHKQAMVSKHLSAASVEFQKPPHSPQLQAEHHAQPIFDFFLEVGIPSIVIVGSLGVIPSRAHPKVRSPNTIEAEPDSFRHLVTEINKRNPV